MFTEPRKGPPIGDDGRSSQRMGSSKRVGSESEDPEQVPLLGFRVKYTAKGMRGFCWYILMFSGHDQGRQAEELVAGPALSHCCTWFPGWGCSSSVCGEVKAPRK